MRRRFAVVRAVVLAVALATTAACTAPQDAPSSGAPGQSETAPSPSGAASSAGQAHPRPDDMPGWLEVPPAPPLCPAATADVRTAAELTDALATARPGDVVVLADGVYRGRFVAERPGTVDAPVHLCGGPGAVLEGPGADEGYVLHLDGASHWVVQGLTVTRGQKGVMVDGATGVTLRGLHVHRTGDEAVHLRRGTTDSRVQDLLIHTTGLREPRFGEGVYVGSAESNWCDLTDCAPDRSDRNQVTGTVVYGTTAEAVDVKEGTRGGVLRGNRFDGAGMSADAGDSWVALKGNGWTVVGNEGRHSPRDGFQITVQRDGWGRRNVVEDNRGSLDRADGVLVAVARQVRGSTVGACANEVRGPARLTDVPCG